MGEGLSNKVLCLSLAAWWACDPTEANGILSPSWGSPSLGEQEGRHTLSRLCPKRVHPPSWGVPCHNHHPQESLPPHLTSSLTTSQTSSRPRTFVACCFLHLEPSVPDLPLHDWLLLIISASIRGVLGEACQDLRLSPDPHSWPVSIAYSDCVSSCIHHHSSGCFTDLLVGLFLSASPHLMSAP